LAGCASAKLTPLSDQATNSVFFSKNPDRPYREVAYVEHTGSIFSNRAQLLRRLQERQTKAQGDALTQVRYDYHFWWPHASAIVVKYQ
jgi:hypothetical protein